MFKVYPNDVQAALIIQQCVGDSRHFCYLCLLKQGLNGDVTSSSLGIELLPCLLIIQHSYLESMPNETLCQESLTLRNHFAMFQ